MIEQRQRLISACGRIRPELPRGTAVRLTFQIGIQHVGLQAADSKWLTAIGAPQISIAQLKRNIAE